MATPGQRIDDRDREQVRKLMKVRGMTVSGVARAAGMSRPTVRKILSETR